MKNNNYIIAIGILVFVALVVLIIVFVRKYMNAVAEKRSALLGPNAPDSNVYPKAVVAQRQTDQMWQLLLTSWVSSTTSVTLGGKGGINTGAISTPTASMYTKPYAVVWNPTMGSTSDSTVFSTSAGAVSFYNTAYNSTTVNKMFQLFPSGTANTVYSNFIVQ